MELARMFGLLYDVLRIRFTHSFIPSINVCWVLRIFKVCYFRCWWYTANKTDIHLFLWSWHYVWVQWKIPKKAWINKAISEWNDAIQCDMIKTLLGWGKCYITLEAKKVHCMDYCPFWENEKSKNPRCIGNPVSK